MFSTHEIETANNLHRLLEAKRDTLNDRVSHLALEYKAACDELEETHQVALTMLGVLEVLIGSTTGEELFESFTEGKPPIESVQAPSEVESIDKSEPEHSPLPEPEQEQPPVVDTPKRWSANSDRCIDCRSAEKPHEAHGRCKVCDSRWRRAQSVTGTPAKELEAKTVEALKQASKVVDVPKPEPDPEDPRKRQKTSKGVLDLYPHIVESADRQKFSFVVRSIRNADRTTNEIVARDHLREATDAAVCTLQTLQQFRNKHLYRFQKLASTSSSSDVNGLLQDWYRDMEIEAATS